MWWMQRCMSHFTKRWTTKIPQRKSGLIRTQCLDLQSRMAGALNKMSLAHMQIDTKKTAYNVALGNTPERFKFFAGSNFDPVDTLNSSQRSSQWHCEVRIWIWDSSAVRVHKTRFCQLRWPSLNVYRSQFKVIQLCSGRCSQIMHERQKERATHRLTGWPAGKLF